MIDVYSQCVVVLTDCLTDNSSIFRKWRIIVFEIST